MYDALLLEGMPLFSFYKIHGLQPNTDNGDVATGLIRSHASVRTISQGYFNSNGVFRITVYFRIITLHPTTREVMRSSVETLLRQRMHNPAIRVEFTGPRNSE